jgi:chaperonin GroEL (HSP60 family)
MAEAGILDSVRVLRGALLAAVSAAAMAITTDVLVLRSDQRRPLQAAP